MRSLLVGVENSIGDIELCSWNNTVVHFMMLRRQGTIVLQLGEIAVRTSPPAPGHALMFQA